MLSNSSALRSQDLLPPPSRHLPLQISVGIVVFNEEAQMTRVFHLLAQQELLPREIIVVDNGSDDHTLEIVNSLRHDISIPIQILRSPTNNMGLARSMVVTEATSPFVAFLDADCSPPPNWLGELSAQFSEGRKIYGAQLAGVCGANRLPETSKFKRAVNLVLKSPLGHGYSPQAWRPTCVRPTDHLPTTNCLIFKDALLLSGNFSHARVRAGEDVEMGRRLRKNGWILLLCPTPVMINDSAQTLKEWTERMRRFGQANQELMTRTPGFRHGPSWLAVLILMAAVLFFITKISWLQALWPLGIYFSLIAIEAIRLERRSLKNQLRVASLLVLTHANYFWGWVAGSFASSVTARFTR